MICLSTWPYVFSYHEDKDNYLSRRSLDKNARKVKATFNRSSLTAVCSKMSQDDQYKARGEKEITPTRLHHLIQKKLLDEKSGWYVESSPRMRREKIKLGSGVYWKNKRRRGHAQRRQSAITCKCTAIKFVESATKQGQFVLSVDKAPTAIN